MNRKTRQFLITGDETIGKQTPLIAIDLKVRLAQEFRSRVATGNFKKAIKLNPEIIKKI